MHIRDEASRELQRLKDEAVKERDRLDQMIHGLTDAIKTTRGSFSIPGSTKRSSPRKDSKRARKAAATELAFLRVIADAGGELDGQSINQTTGRDSGTNYGAFKRLERQGEVERLNRKVEKSWVYSLTSQGEKRLAQSDETPADTEPEARPRRAQAERAKPDAAAMAEAKRVADQARSPGVPAPAKSREPGTPRTDGRPKDYRPVEQKAADVMEILRQAGGELRAGKLRQRTPFGQSALYRVLAYLESRGEVEVERRGDPHTPNTMQTTIRIPRREHETVVRPGEGLVGGGVR